MIWQLSIVLNFCIFTFVVCQKNYIEYPHYPCAVGDVAENDCNYCVCNSNLVYECYVKKCELSAETELIQEELQCQPRVVYLNKLQDVACICNKHGKWPHDKCHRTFRSFHKNNSQSCTPNSYVKVDCNICRCNAKGQVDIEYCTKNECIEISVKTTRKALPLPQSVHGHCEPKNWYSLAPCQFCFCINTNKLVCNTADFYVNKLQLGKYNLNVCGKEFIKEAIDLIPTDRSNSLRNQNVKTTTPTVITEAPTMIPTRTITKSNAVNNLPMIIREVITHQKSNDQDGSTEYSDAEDNAKSNLAIPEPKIDIKPLDNVEFDEIKLDKPKDYDDEEEVSDNDAKSTQVSPKAQNTKPAVNVDRIIINVDNINKSMAHNILREKRGEDNYVLDVFVPNVLESLFNIQMRKSLVKLENSECSPGTKENVGCNTCFCLSNGKKLCTDRPCQ